MSIVGRRRLTAWRRPNVGTALLNLMESTPLWEGTASQLLARLHECLPEAISRKKFLHRPEACRASFAAFNRIERSRN